MKHYSDDVKLHFLDFTKEGQGIRLIIEFSNGDWVFQAGYCNENTPSRHSMTHVRYAQLIAGDIRLDDWVYARQRSRRARAVVASIVFFDMEYDVWYTADELVEFQHKYNPKGRNGMTIDATRIGALMRALNGRDIVEIDPKPRGFGNKKYKVISKYSRD